MNAVDLRCCLEGWPYDPEKNVIVGRGADRREIILVRLPMGLEQMKSMVARMAGACMARSRFSTGIVPGSALHCRMGRRRWLA